MTDDTLPFDVTVSREYVKVFREELTKRVPDPSTKQLIRTDYEYSMTELKDLLQILGAHLSTLTAIVGELEADNFIMSEGFKMTMQDGLANYKGDATQVTMKQSEVLARNPQLKNVKRLDIETEACLILCRSWRRAYEDAYTTVSRIGSFDMTEASLQTSRHN